MSAVPAIQVSAVSALRGDGYRLMFLGFFGSWWTLAGCLGFYGASIPVLLVVAVAGVAIFLIGLLLSRSAGEEVVAQDKPDGRLRRQRTFRNINIAQWGAIAMLIVVLNVVGRTEWIWCGLMLIVGLHFLPLAKLFASPINVYTGLALIGVAVVYPLVSQGPTSPSGPLAAGLVLWVSALITLAGAMGGRSAQK
jgi:hypothetical protein